MKCVNCRHVETVSRTKTVTLERDGFIYVVPANVCPNCDGDYVSEGITAALLKGAVQMVRSDTMADIRQYLAA